MILFILFTLNLILGAIAMLIILAILVRKFIGE